MEAVHKPEEHDWIDGEVRNVKQFLTDWMESLSLDNNDASSGSVLLEDLISEEEYLEVEKMCGLDTLKCQYQDVVEPSNSITIPEDVDLKTVRYQEEELKKKATSKKHVAALYPHNKQQNYPPPLKNFSSLTNLSEIPFEPVTVPDVVLSVQIFLPVKRSDCYKVNTSTDEMPSFQDLYKSGFFYINNVFYNDMRDKDCRDYSETIINWAASGDHKIGPFKKALMEKTKFIDLNIQLGYPYVYTHQGDCEHLMVFSDLRLFSKDDENNKNAYPLYMHVKPAKRVFCMVCHEDTASSVVYDNNRLPQNPYFFCKTCFLEFNYDADNRKIGDFKAYYYPNASKFD